MTDRCVHCGLCTQKCSFLQKYDMDLAAFAEHPELAYHCFLCGECSRVCPQELDGRELALTMRRAQTADNGGTPQESGYRLLLAEKKNYLFRNYRKKNGCTALFPGCNFPSFFPETTDALVRLCANAGIGVVYDCCGKPVSELGAQPLARDAAAKLHKRIRAEGIERLIVLCPNCYYYLKEHLDIEIVSIYEILPELGFDLAINEGSAPVFLPCPDRKTQKLFAQLHTFLPHAAVVDTPQCCGLGGCASAKEADLASGFAAAANALPHTVLYTYCASCTGQLHRHGAQHIVHLLPEILGTHETPAHSAAKTLWNRAKRVF